MPNKLQWNGIENGLGGYLQRNVGLYLDRGLSDRDAFEAAIKDVEDGEDATIRVPNIGRSYELDTGYLTYSSRRVTWFVEDGVSFGDDSEWAKLNAKVITSRGIFMHGMHGVFDAGQTIKMGGGGALTNRKDAITGTEDTETLAYKHERGRAGKYSSIGSTGTIRIPSANFTSSAFLPDTAIDVNPLRVGMVVDVVGTTLYSGNASTCRHTGTIINWDSDGSKIYVDGWWRDDGSGTGATKATPQSGRAVVINAVNKLWVHAGDVFLSDTDGDSYGYVSGSFFEMSVLNATGQDFETEFDQNTLPLHFYGYDANISSSAYQWGGGNAFVARGSHKSWENALYVMSAQNGLHMAAKPQNSGGTAVLASREGANGPDYLARSRSFLNDAWNRNVDIEADQPIIHMGRDYEASTPIINLHSSGHNNAYDVRVFATGGTDAVDGSGSLVIQLGALQLVGIPTSEPAGSDLVWRDNDYLKITS